MAEEGGTVELTQYFPTIASATQPTGNLSVIQYFNILCKCTNLLPRSIKHGYFKNKQCLEKYGVVHKYVRRESATHDFKHLRGRTATVDAERVL